MADDWRVTATFSDTASARQAAQSLRDHEVQDDIRRRLGHRVAVSADGPSVFLYAATEDTAREADLVLREVLAQHELSAELALDRWHPGEQDWEDASVPMPDSDEARAAEQQRLMDDEAEQAAAAGAAGWQVRVQLPSHRQAVDLAEQFLAEGRPVVRRWKYLILGASSEDEAGALAEAIRQEAPANSSVRTEPNPWAHFVIRQAGTAAVPYYHFD